MPLGNNHKFKSILQSTIEASNQSSVNHMFSVTGLLHGMIVKCNTKSEAEKAFKAAWKNDQITQTLQMK